MAFEVALYLLVLERWMGDLSGDAIGVAQLSRRLQFLGVEVFRGRNHHARLVKLRDREAWLPIMGAAFVSPPPLVPQPSDK